MSVLWHRDRPDARRARTKRAPIGGSAETSPPGVWSTIPSQYLRRRGWLPAVKSRGKVSSVGSGGAARIFVE